MFGAGQFNFIVLVPLQTVGVRSTVAPPDNSECPSTTIPNIQKLTAIGLSLASRSPGTPPQNAVRSASCAHRGYLTPLSKNFINTLKNT